MFKDLSLKAVSLFIALCALQACDSDNQVSTDTTDNKPAASDAMPAAAPMQEPAKETQREAANETVNRLVPEPAAELQHDVVNQEEIYKNWPYQEEARNIKPMQDTQQAMPEDASGSVQQVISDTVAEKTEQAREMLDDAMQQGKDMVAAAVEPASGNANAGDKPYQVVDGKISQNALEGWKTYNGGGCGACHGKGGQGGVGPNLGQSVTQKLSEEQFKNIVINGVSGTLMRPHKSNKRVMDNLDNLYAYLLARGDDVLGPGNLIKSPLGK